MALPQPTPKRPRRRVARLGVWLVSAGLVAAWAIPTRAEPPRTPEPIVWGQEVFVIPYRWSRAARPGDPQEVVLHVSRDRGVTWQEVSRARPDVRSFVYRAAADGEYWFAVQSPNSVPAPTAAGPSGGLHAELQVVVDTTIPQVKITEALIDPSGSVRVAFEAADANLAPQGVRLALRDPASGAWVDVPIEFDPAQGGVVRGHATRTMGVAAQSVLVRVAATDRAGNPAGAGGQATPQGLAPSPAEAQRLFSTVAWGPTPPAAAEPVGPRLSGPQPPSDPFLSQSALAPPPQQSAAAVPYPSTGPFPATQAPRPEETPAAPSTFAAAASPPPGWRSAGSSPPAPDTQTWAPDQGAPTPRVAAGLPPAGPPPVGVDPSGGVFRTAGLSTPLDPGVLRVNSRRFELEYDLQAVGTWGVSKVEVWGTRDGGRTWRSYALDTDLKSPVDVEAPGPGRYGFRVVVESVGGLQSEPPRPGDRPDVVVEVDLERPEARLVSALQGEGYFADHLVVTWRAGDANLDGRPVALFYSDRPEGPWAPMASNLDNSGRYAWRLQRHVPRSLYLRLEVRDAAGNLAIDQTPHPVNLTIPEPVGQIRTVRPIGG